MPPAMGIGDAIAFTETILEERIESWKKFLSNQKIIRFIEDRKEIASLKSDFSFEQALFVILYPKSFLHLNDFQNGLPSANAAAIFHKNGSVNLLVNDNEPQRVTFSDAWKEIVLRTTGKNLEFLLTVEMPKENLELKNVVEVQKEVSRRIKDWVDLFNKIPGIKAFVYDAEDSEKIVDIKILRNLKSFLGFGSPPSLEPEVPHAWFALLLDGTFVNYISENGNGMKEDSIYANWKKELDASDAHNWADFYRWAIKLTRRYEEAVPDAKENH